MASGLRVCVIGAGAAGLCAARHVSAQSQFFQKPVVYELNGVLGGTWVYNEEVGLDKFGNPIHSSMYERMKTNLPKEVMAFPDFAFPPSEDSFLHHTRIRGYLEAYCTHFGLDSCIQYERKVELVEPINSTSTWRVRVLDLASKSLEDVIFDIVLVCNGHYSVPYRAPIPNISQFQGVQSHSHEYRKPQALAGQNVALLGAAASGMDISLEVAEAANQVYLCHNKPPLPSKLPANLVQVPGIVECISERGFLLDDGSKIQVDHLMYCTGYAFKFPFLGDGCQVQVEGQVVKPLYRHMVHAEHPTMAFVGIPGQICPFPFFHYQILWYLKFFTDAKLSLPTEAAMKADTQAELVQRLSQGTAERHFHRMGALQWEYTRNLALMAELEEHPHPEVEQLYNLVHHRRVQSLMDYKSDQFFQESDGTFRLRDL